MREDMKQLISRARPWAIRALYLGFVGSFMLPYVTVTGCSDGKVTMVYGYQLFVDETAVLYAAAIAIMLLCLGLSFRRKGVSPSLSAFAAAWRAISAALCGMIAGLMPGIQFLFDSVSPRAGQVMALSCAAALFAEGAIGSLYGFAVLRKDRAAVPPERKGLGIFHRAVLGLSLAMVPFYFIGLGNEWVIALLYFFLLTLPLVLAQLITLEGVLRGESWPSHWAKAAALLMGLALTLTALLYC